MPPSRPDDSGSGLEPESEHTTAEQLGLDLSKLPRSQAEAQERYEKWQLKDPFPEVAPALLNSADLFDYIATTGMIHPFDLNPLKVDEVLKPASCGIALGGECVYWSYESSEALDGEPKKTVRELDSAGVLELPPNSIVYAALSPTFRLPGYIAARFNLSIKYVYRGLLVGTGPLVDPGFSGRLRIPLHNLTSSTCSIPASDAVLWMEFTKLSFNAEWEGGGEDEPRSGRYVSFPERKREKRSTLDDYLKHANGGKPIVSSIPESIEQAEQSARQAERLAKSAAEAAETARERSETARERSQQIQFLTIIGVTVTIFAAVTGLVAYMNDVQTGIRNDADTALHRSNELEAELIRVKNRLRRSNESAQAKSAPGNSSE
ncbi:MAG TPA: hypothetical protein VNM89_03710 [Solirubrobacterales bacterium]|nr:hypothetical protein [Solirubrobacterales bacterium]